MENELIDLAQKQLEKSEREERVRRLERLLFHKKQLEREILEVCNESIPLPKDIGRY